MVKEIPLTQGQVALVDDEDFDRVNQFKWYAYIKHGRFHVQRSDVSGGKKRTVHLRRIILGIDDSSIFVIHADGNGLNCQRSNLLLSGNPKRRTIDSDLPSSSPEYKRERERQYRRAHLKECVEYSKKWQLAHREEHLRRARERMAKKRVTQYTRVKAIERKNTLKRFHNMTPAEYENLFQQQGGVCAICGTASASNKHLCVDHDHKSGRVRGLLCGACNQALGLARDDIQILTNMITYLSRTQDVLAPSGQIIHPI